MITDIKISNFRGIGDLELTGLKQVNLIVGDNNSGKTSLLEAIVAAASPGLVGKLPGLFRSNSGKVAERYFKWLLRNGSSSATIRLAGDVQAELNLRSVTGQVSSRWDEYEEFGGIAFEYGPDSRSLKSRAVSVQHRSLDSIIANFADAVRSPENEKRMEGLLHKLDPRILSARLDLIDDEQVISLDVGLSERMPLSQLGQGTYRVVSILSDLMGSKPDLFLIDEIENGVHYTALPKIWRALAEIAAAMDIQIFATTHSKECLEAAHRVFYDEDSEGNRDLAVIQLMGVDGNVIARVLDEERVNDALEIDTELR
jgi:ABC-type molybdenum transport system ATPase subunit/photorepair protein PhrA